MTSEPTLQQVLDGLEALGTQIGTRLDGVDQRLDVMEGRITVLADRQNHVTDHLASLDGRVDLLTTECGLLRSDVTTRLDTLDRVVGGLDRDVQALTRRVMERGQDTG